MNVSQDVLKLTDLIYKQLKLLPPSTNSNTAISALAQLLFIIGDMLSALDEDADAVLKEIYRLTSKAWEDISL